MECGAVSGLPKVRTGIEGFDQTSYGGLPKGRTTVVAGASGTGKTVFALQTLINGVREFGEPGIFVAFEEAPEAVRDNARGFGWDLPAMEAEGCLALVDARLSPDTIASGAFDLTALLANIGSRAEAIRARLVVFDAVDALLVVLDSAPAERSELRRIRDWLAASDLTGIITIRLPVDEYGGENGSRFGLVQYMTDCVVLLQQAVLERVALRTVRILKYRGSGFCANEFPLVIGAQGVQVAAFGLAERPSAAFTERVGTGVARLDSMLEGGYYRGSSVLVTGAPGTAKSTLCAAFVDSACRRGERALYVSFDEHPDEIVRNFRSVNIDLQPHRESGLLHLEYARSEARSADEHLFAIQSLVREHHPSCMVVDPLSAILKAGGPLVAVPASVEIVQFAKAHGITFVFSSLVAAPQPMEQAELRVSTIADSWLHLSFAIQAGERNRALTIVKARGTGHSNQVRELVLSDDGITLADVYSAGGEVLMGTLRTEKELAEELERERQRQEVEARRRALEVSRIRIEAQLESLQGELEAKQGELELLRQEAALRERRWSVLRERVEVERRADVDGPAPTDES